MYRVERALRRCVAITQTLERVQKECPPRSCWKPIASMRSGSVNADDQHAEGLATTAGASRLGSRCRAADRVDAVALFATGDPVGTCSPRAVGVVRPGGPQMTAHRCLRHVEHLRDSPLRVAGGTQVVDCKGLVHRQLIRHGALAGRLSAVKADHLRVAAPEEQLVPFQALLRGTVWAPTDILHCELPYR